jgi:flagellar biosynthesis regulator FlbT
MMILNPKAKESQQQEYDKQIEWLAQVNAGEIPHEIGGVTITTTRKKVLQSNLWKSINGLLPEDKIVEVLSALRNVYMSDAKIDLDMDNLDSAMTWEETPQGHAYWAELHSICMENDI